MNRRNEPTRFECLAVLGLPPRATWRQIQRAYRRSALRYHPDRCAWHSHPNVDRARFHQVTQAYAILQRTAPPINRPSALGPCRRCGDMETLQPSLDGNGYCCTCRTHAGGKRMLPGPPPVWVRFGAIMGGLMASAAFLIAWWIAGQPSFWWISIALCAASMSTMAATCMLVPCVAAPASGTISPARRSRRSTGLTSRSRHRYPRWLRAALNS